MAERLADDQIVELINTCFEGEASDLTYDGFKTLLADQAHGNVATAIVEKCPVSSTPSSQAVNSEQQLTISFRISMAAPQST
jgi:hypothetical protein